MRCPICKKSVPEPQHTAEGPRGAKPSSTFPFCSDRCKLIDLGRWLDGKYQIPAIEDDADEGSLPVSADDLAAD